MAIQGAQDKSGQNFFISFKNHNFCFGLKTEQNIVWAIKWASLGNI